MQLLFSLFFCIITLSLHALETPRDPVSWLITQEGKPTDSLQRLLELSHIYDPQDCLPEIVQKTQKAWIKVIQGKDGKERTDMQDSPEEVAIRESVVAIGKEIGLFNARKPHIRHYNYAICHGAFLDGVKMRIQELVEAWKEGIRFDSLVFLTGERALRKEQQDAVSKILGAKPLPKDVAYETEYDMCKLVWEHADVPRDMRQALLGKIVLVNAKRPEGCARPNTKETFVTWLKESRPTPGTILAYSYPMLWTYQQVAGENMLGKDFILDTCAKAVTSELLEAQNPRIVSLVHDTVAKVLYEANLRG